MDEELKAYLEAKFAEVRVEIQQSVRVDIAEVRVSVRADIEKSETNLLRAFHGWARSMERISEVERKQAS
jgi:hypothetical protein